MGGGPKPEDACPRSQAPLTDTARKAIERALADERQVEARHATIDGQFHDARLRLAARTDRRHSSRLEALLVAHLAPIPPAAVPVETSFASRRIACTAALSLEYRNITTYDVLLQEQLPDDVRCVFRSLRQASKDEYVPQLERCLIE